jgi:hypothetical protein
MYDDWFNFKETSALNNNWELLMIDNKNFMINSGSFFIIVVYMVIYSLVKTVYNLIAKKYAHVYAFRRIGVLINSSDNKLVPGITKLHLEMYLDMAIALFLMAFAFGEEENGKT